MLERLYDVLSAGSIDFAYACVFLLLLLCGFGLPMPEDVILVTGGVLAWVASDLDVATFSGMLHDPQLLTMSAVGLAGILAGDSVIFFAGRRFGHRVAEFGPLRRVITPEKLEFVEKKIRTRGNVVVVFARFLPGVRAPTYFTVGHARMPYWKFMLYDGAAALISAPAWVCVGFYFGSDIQEAAHVARQFGHYILLGVIVILLGLTLRWLQTRRAAGARVATPEPDADPERD